MPMQRRERSSGTMSRHGRGEDGSDSNRDSMRAVSQRLIATHEARSHIDWINPHSNPTPSTR